MAVPLAPHPYHAHNSRAYDPSDAPLLHLWPLRHHLPFVPEATSQPRGAERLAPPAAQTPLPAPAPPHWLWNNNSAPGMCSSTQHGARSTEHSGDVSRWQAMTRGRSDRRRGCDSTRCPCTCSRNHRRNKDHCPTGTALQHLRNASVPSTAQRRSGSDSDADAHRSPPSRADAGTTWYHLHRAATIVLDPSTVQLRKREEQAES